MLRQDMSIKSGKGRIDLRIKNLRIIDEQKHVVYFEAELDPERYERTEVDGKKAWLDKSSNIIYTEDVIKEAIKGSKRLPIYYSPPKIGDFGKYFEDSKARIAKSLISDPKFEPSVDISDAFLELNRDREMMFIVLYIDLVGSTEMSRTLESQKLKKLISVFSQEMTLMVNGYRGYVLKYAGDCVIAYFPGDINFPGMVDNSVECAIAMKTFIKRALNPVLHEMCYPELRFKIGMDCGENQIVELGAEDIKSSRDLLGYTMNVAMKICSLAKPDQLLIGRSVYENLHISRQRFFTKIDLPQNWKYLDAMFGRIYDVYALKEN